VRTYGRVTDEYGNKTWVTVESNPQQGDDYVFCTALCQVLKLNLNESPFYANYGIPAHPSVIQQIAPDYNVALTQKQFSQYFANLSISKLPPLPNDPTPQYNVSITTHQGVQPDMGQIPQ